MKLTALARLQRPQADCRSTQLNLVALTASGYWFCTVCERPTELNVDGTQSVCQYCGLPKVRLIEGALKPVLALLALLVCLTGQAQSTFVNYRLNIVGGVASTNISVGPNTLVRGANSQGVNLTGATMTVTYPGAPAISINLADPASADIFTKPILGPCTIQFSLTGAAGAVGFMLLQYDVVNTTLPAQGVLVQPAGHGAAVSFQSSTDLTTWSTATNGVYAAGQNRFFRMGLNLQ
jgi:hypothetical protein